MEVTNRLLAFAAYVAGGLAIAAGTYLATVYYRSQDVSAPDGQNAIGSSASDGPSTVEGGGAGQGIHVDYLYAQRAQIKSLQTLLEQKTELLEQKTKLLDAKTAEHMSLRADLDDAISMLEMLAAEVVDQDTQQLRRESGSDQLQAELDKLRRESERSRQLAKRQEAESERLKTEMLLTDEQILLLQRETEEEIDALAEEKRALENVASDAFARIGPAAVPVLASYLTHQRVDVRRWATEVLGSMGPDANDAIPALIDALSDADPGVRAEARRALDLIDPAQR